MKINVNKAPGPNDSVLKISKEFALVLAVPLTEIFNDSFREKYFPKMWKQYKLKGISKSIPCSTVDNLRPIALTSVLSKVQESFVLDWINEDIHDKISESQLGGIRNSSTSLALLYLIHKWYEAMDTPNRIIRIIFLDFKKAFYLIDHNVLLKDIKFIGVRMALIKWFATYLNERSHWFELGNDTSDLRVIGGGVPQGSKIGPILIAFIIKINNLPAVIREEMSQIMATNSEACSVVDDDIIMFMGDSTLYEMLDVSTHTSGMPIGGLLAKINRIVKFTEDEKMV